VWYQNIRGALFGFVTKHACDGRTDRRTDGRTDGQNYDSQDRASTAASRGKNQDLNRPATHGLSEWKLAPSPKITGKINIQLSKQTIDITQGCQQLQFHILEISNVPNIGAANNVLWLTETIFGWIVVHLAHPTAPFQQYTGVYSPPR